MPESADRITLFTSQEHLWIIDQISSEGSHNVPLCYPYSGRLDEAALCRAVHDLTERQEALRTCTGDIRGAPFGSLPTLETTPADFARACAADAGTLDSLLAEAALRLFDLATGPLLRTLVVDLADDTAVVLLVLHHGASNGLFGRILTRELWQSYDAYAAGRTPELAGSFAAFAQQERDWLESEEARDQLAYWTRQLADAPPPPALGRPIPGQQLSDAVVEFTIPPQPVESVTKACADLCATVFMLLLAGYAGALARHTGVADVIVATPVTDPPTEELEGVVGPFDNTVLLRIVTDSDPTSGELVERVRDVAVDGLLNKDIPFQHVARALAPARGASVAPALSNVAFSAEEAEPDPGPVHSGLVTAHPWVLVPPVRFEQTLMVELSPPGDDGPALLRPRAGRPALRPVDRPGHNGPADPVRHPSRVPAGHRPSGRART